MLRAKYKYKEQILFLPFSFCQRDQLLRHPFADALRDRIVDADCSIVPIVTAPFRTTRTFVVFRLFETDKYSVYDFAPVLKLNSASDDRKSGGPVFFRRACVLLGNSQIMKWRKWPPAKSLTSCSLSCLNDQSECSCRNDCARRKMSATVGCC